MVSQLGTVRIKGVDLNCEFELNVASSLSSTQEVISHVQVTEANSTWIFSTLHP
jgi:hypothetical protein